MTNLAFGELPDYELVERIFKNCLPKEVTDETRYDWETILQSPSDNEDTTMTTKHQKPLVVMALELD